MKKVTFLLFLFFLIYPQSIQAQTAQPSTVVVSSAISASPSARNTLQLLQNDESVRVHLNRFFRRIHAVEGRLQKINNKLESRLSKVTVPNNSVSRINAQYKRLTDESTALQADINEATTVWEQISQSRNTVEYRQFRASLTDLVDSIETHVRNQKTFLAELKRHRPKVAPTESVATRSPDIN